MSEQIPTSVTVIYQCACCTGDLTEQGIVWSCPNSHPEATTGAGAASTPTQTAEKQESEKQP